MLSKKVIRFFQTYKKQTKKRFSIAILLIIVTLMLSACSYPGQDLPCQGANATQAGCTNPALQITDTDPDGSWYVHWGLDIIRPIIADGATSSVKLSINVFWSLFTNLSSIDFAGCVNNNGNNNNNGNTTPPAICTASNAYSTIQIVAVALIPLVLIWKIFKSYIVGALVEQAHESFWSFFAKIFLGAFIIPFLPDIITVTLGMSDLIFSSIIGSAQSINDVASNILGHGNCNSNPSDILQHTTAMVTTSGNFGTSAPVGLNHLFATATNLAAAPTTPSGCSGIQSMGQVRNIGLLIVITLFCLLTSIVWVLLGLCFLLRGIILFILFCLSPLAVVAGMTEEFRPWLGRWLEQMQAMLIAPIPVAICIALVEAFSKSLPSAHDDPANFILQLIYVVAFLLIAALLMFKIAGAAGGVMFGLAVAGLSAAAGLVTGGIGAGIANIKSGGGSSATDGASANDNTTALTSPPSATTNTTTVVAASRSASAASDATGTGAAAAPAITSVAVIQQSQTEMTNALRTMNANNSANMINNAGGSAMLSNFRFGHTAHSNMQAMGHYLGNAVGVSGPRFSFVPSGGGYYGGGRSSYGGGNGGGSYGDGPSSISTMSNVVIVNGGGDGGASASNSPADNESAPPPPDSDSPTIKGAIGELFRWPNSGDNGGGNAGNSNQPSPAPVPNNGGGGGSSVSVSPAMPRQKFKPMPDAPVWTSVPSSYPTDYNPDWNGQADKFGTGGLYPDVAKAPVPRAVDSTKNPVANPFVGDNKPQVPPLLALTASGSSGSTNGNKPGEQDISTPQVEE